MKKLFTLSILVSFSILNLQAQQTKSFGPSINIGAGVTNPSSAIKSTNNIGSLTNFNIGAYIPVFNISNRVNFGLNLGGEYAVGNKDYNLGGFTTYNISGEASPPTIAAKGSGSPKQQGFKTEGGIQANISLGPIIISPMLNVGYLSFKQKAFTVTQTSDVNGKTNNYSLYSQADAKSSGFAFIPKLKVGYNPGRLGFFVEGNYTMGPNINNETSIFKPQGTANPKDGKYSIDQMISGKSIAQTNTTKYKSIGVNVGISFFLSKKGYDHWKAQSDMAVVSPAAGITGGGAVAGIVVAKTVSPSATVGSEQVTPKKVHCACGIEVYGKDEAACLRICQFLKDGTYGSAKLSDSELSAIKEDYLNSLTITENGVSILKPELFKEVKSQSDWKDKKVSISKGDQKYVFLGNQDDLVKIISIQTKQRVKECTDCTTVTCNGTTYNCTCVNGFCMCVLCIEITKLSTEDKIISPDNDKGGESGMPTFDAFVAGEPIGGIIVKGGRNPGGQMFTVNTNASGEFEFEVKESGDYLLMLTSSPELEKAVKTKTSANAITKNPLYQPSGNSGDNPLYQGFVAGTPIGGIIVKGGKNPVGQVITINTNGKGELELKNLTPGNYKFIASSPRKGWDGTVKGGSKVTTPDNARKGWDGTVKGGSKVTTPDNARKGWDGTVKGGSKVATPDNARKGWDGTVKGGSKTFDAFVAGEPIGGIIVKGGRNPGGQMLTITTNSNGAFEFEAKESGDYLFVLTSSPELEAMASKKFKSKNPLYNPSGNSGDNPIYQGFVAGEPIGGIIVKGGRNPGGQMMIINTNGNGELELKNLAPGNYKFITTSPRKGWDGTVKGGSKVATPDNARKGWDGTVKGGPKVATPDNARKGWDGTVKGGSKTFDAFIAGEPIGGIIVKGGRNPGGQMLTTTTNSNGAFEFEVKESGDYLFVLTSSPELEASARKRAATKSAKKATSNATVKNPLYNPSGTSGDNPIYQGFVAGEPIGGIVVKGGRNPGGQMFILTSSANGEITLKNLEAANYKFIVTAPTSQKKGKNPSQNSEHMSPLYKGN